MRIGVFGGMFDPPHLGHLILAELACEQLKLDSIIFIPTGTHPLKNASLYSSPAHRLAMTKLAIEANPKFVLSDREIIKSENSFTVDTLEAIATEHSDSKLYLLLGMDNIAIFDQWHKTDRILELSTIAVYDRLAEKTVSIPEELSNKITRIHSPLIGISSTMVRERVKNNLSIQYFTPDAVREYIFEHHLYMG